MTATFSRADRVLAVPLMPFCLLVVIAVLIRRWLADAWERSHRRHALVRGLR